MYSAPATPQYAYAPPMPTFERGGRVKETYGLENAAEMIRRQGREGDTVLAHISPEEAGILKLLGGSGTINPYTGLPEYKSFLKKIVPKPIYKLGSEIGQAIEGGIESIARNKVLGPIAQIASYLHPVTAALYAGLAPPGSSFDIKGAAKAAALQQIGQGIKTSLGAPPGGLSPDGIDPTSIAGYSYPTLDPTGIDPTSLADYSYPTLDPTGIDPTSIADYSASPIGAVESAVSSAPFATGPEVVNAGITPPIERGVDINQIPAGGGAPAPAPVPSVDPYAVDNVGNISESRMLGDGYGRAPSETYNIPRAEDATGIRGLDAAGENVLGAAGSLAEGAYDLAASNPMTTASIAYGGYTAYQTKKELDAAKAEADRILADRANKKAEEIAWAQSVLRDYPYNYQRLTEEDVRRERGMAMGGRIDSYDDEIGGDDNMMQGGIASLAKGGLPPRYLRGGGDGMSDSIRARIGGKQEARLADGEFVVPADVVSHLGNGSSNAGAKKLYAMMDRIRKSRTGKTSQAPQVNTRKMMPA